MSRIRKFQPAGLVAIGDILTALLVGAGRRTRMNRVPDMDRPIN
ncbi:MAG TPA: hypothetical protein VM389_13735 [Phycisphaerae bacterium]|nr:hypothetical protein [Phycisphaerae bacterium]